MRELIKSLCAQYGATGNESNITGFIRGLVAPYVDEIRTDALGNLICVKKPSKDGGKRIMIAAHTDHIGFIVTDADKNGFLRVHNVGGIDRGVSLNRHVVFENGVSGVLSYELQDYNPASNDMSVLFIDIGAKSREDALSKVMIGDVAVYAPDVFDLGDYISGPSMDDRVGCAVLVKLLRETKNCPHEICAVFTSQEEVGLRGARAAAFSIEPDMGIALDVTLAGDTPKGDKIAIELGKGPAVKIMDSSLVCTPMIVEKLEAAAERASVRWQREVLTLGGTDAAAIQSAKGGRPAGVVSIPCRYTHSATETISVSDAENAVTLLKSFLNDETL